MKPKILILLNGFWTSIGGGDIHLLEVGKELTQLGADINFMIPDDAEYDEYKKYIHCIYPYNSNLIGKGKDCHNFLSISLLYWKRQRAIISYMKKNQAEMKTYTHVICSGPFLYDLDATIYLKTNINPKIKTICMWHHTTKQSNGLRYELAKIQERNAITKVKKHIDLIITSNIIEQEKLLQLTDKPVMLTSHGVDWNLINNCHTGSVDHLSACFVGRLEKSKGVYDLLHAWRQVVRCFPEAKLSIIGKGIEQETLKQMAYEFGIYDNIIFYGKVSDKEKYQILSNSKLFLLPSYQEGYGICIAEALSCGCQVIAYNLNHYKGIFGNNITAVPIASWSNMALEVVKSINSEYNPKKINDKVMWCKQTFNWTQVAKDNYNMWIGKKPKGL